MLTTTQNYFPDAKIPLQFSTLETLLYLNARYIDQNLGSLGFTRFVSLLMMSS